MKSETQIRQKFSLLKKQRNDFIAKKMQIEAGERMPYINPKERAKIIVNYSESISNLNGFLEALNWVNK